MFQTKWVEVILLWLALLPAEVQGQAIPFVEAERTNSSGTGTAVQVFHDRYLPTTPLQSSPQAELAFPTLPAGSRLTDTNSPTVYAGLFTRYTNGTAYAVPGYDAGVGVTLPGSPSSIHRIVGTVSSSFTVDTSTGYSNATAGSNSFRTVASVDGSSFWGATAANSDGIIYIPSAGTIGNYTQIVANSARQVRIFNNSLFYSNASGNGGISLAGSVGTLPTTISTATLLSGTNTSGTGTPGSTGFYLFDNPLNSNNWNGTGFDTLYIADDRTSANGGGIQRWVYNGTTWILSSTMAVSAGARGLTAMIDTSGTSPVVSLWSTTADTSNNSLLYFQDTLTAGGGTFGSVTTLATAGTGNMFRSVELGIAIPEPSTYLLLICTAAAFSYYSISRRKQPVAVEPDTTPQKDDPTSTIFLPSLKM